MHFQTVCTAGMRTKFATKPIQEYPPHLRHVATLPRVLLQIQIFCRYSADMTENANKLHIYCPGLCYSSTVTCIQKLKLVQCFHICQIPA